MASRGDRAERELLRELKRMGFCGFRIPASGRGSKERLPDLVVAHRESGIRLAIEVKRTSKDRVYIKRGEINGLIRIATCFRAVPLIAVRFGGEGDYCFTLAELGSDERNIKIVRNKLKLFKLERLGDTRFLACLRDQTTKILNVEC